MVVTVFVAVSITETVLSPLFVIYAYVPADEAPCSVVADAADETKIKHKIRTADAKAADCNFLLVFIYPTPPFFVILTFFMPQLFLQNIALISLVVYCKNLFTIEYKFTRFIKKLISCPLYKALSDIIIFLIII